MTAKDWFGVIVRGAGLQCFVWGASYITGIRKPDIQQGFDSMDYAISMFSYWVPGVILLCFADSIVNIAYADSKEVEEPS